MTTEKAQADFNKLITENGFILTGHTSDTCIPIYHRVWKKQVQVVWHGEMEETLEIRVMLSGPYPLVVVRRDGRQDSKFIRDYTSPKRAFNAIREISRWAGFEM